MRRKVLEALAQGKIKKQPRPSSIGDVMAGIVFCETQQSSPKAQHSLGILSVSSWSGKIPFLGM